MSKNKKIAKQYKDEDEGTRKEGKGSRRRSGYDDRRSKGRNDASWYSAGDPDLLSAVARWPFSRRLGQNIPFKGGRSYEVGTSNTRMVQNTYSAPGIISMGFVPSVGVAEDAQSPINVAANAQYTFIRAANSGARNYDAPDLIIYDMAIDSIYMLLTWAARAYATVGMFSAFNKFYPDDLLKAQHIDPASFGGSLEDYRAKLNILIRKAQSLVVSKSLPIFTRHSWMVGNYFIDGDNIKQQTYLYYPTSYYKFAYDGSGAGMLECTPIFPSTGNNHLGTITCWQLLSIIETALDAVLGDEDFNIMSGDILKAYGSDINTLSEVPGLIVATPVFNREALMQFKNARILPIYIDDDSSHSTIGNLRKLDLIQSVAKDFVQYSYSTATGYQPGYYDEISIEMAWTGVLRSGGDNFYSLGSMPSAVGYMRSMYGSDNILTSDRDNPTPEEVMVYSRLKWGVEYAWTDLGGGLYTFGGAHYTFGSEIPVICEVFYKVNGVTQVAAVGSDVFQLGTEYNGNPYYADDFIPSMTKAFIYMPKRSVVRMYSDSNNVLRYDPVQFDDQWDWDIFSEIDFEHMANLNQAAILAEFNVPRLAVSR